MFGRNASDTVGKTWLAAIPKLGELAPKLQEVLKAQTPIPPGGRLDHAEGKGT